MKKARRSKRQRQKAIDIPPHVKGFFAQDPCCTRGVAIGNGTAQKKRDWFLFAHSPVRNRPAAKHPAPSPSCTLSPQPDKACQAKRRLRQKRSRNAGTMRRNRAFGRLLRHDKRQNLGFLTQTVLEIAQHKRQERNRNNRIDNQGKMGLDPGEAPQKIACGHQ